MSAPLWLIFSVVVLACVVGIWAVLYMRVQQQRAAERISAQYAEMRQQALLKCIRTGLPVVGAMRPDGTYEVNTVRIPLAGDLTERDSNA